MWVAITRRAKGYEGQLHPEEALTRAQAIRFYTINNAHLLFLEDRIGSLEEGKQADFVVIDRDLLTCPEDEIKEHPRAGHLSRRQTRLRPAGVMPSHRAPDRSSLPYSA